MKFFLLIGSAIAAAAHTAPVITSDVLRKFKEFQTTYNVTYSDEEEWALRAAVFANNLVEAERLAELNPQATFGVTKFSDLTPAEFKSRYLAYRPPNFRNTTRVTPQVKAATKIDWRTKNAVTPVKDQGQCGSCWAFSATEAIESYAFLSGKYKLMKLSPQQINSCDDNDNGCGGGDPPTAYEYVMQAGGLEDDADYPYTSGTSGSTGKCKFNKADVKVQVAGHKQLTRSEDSLKAGLNSGPPSICVAAGTWQFYSGGVLTHCGLIPIIDHCVQAIGYDDSASTPYWLVRNSWNTDWGEDGLIRIAQGSNLCKLQNEATFPTF